MSVNTKFSMIDHSYGKSKIKLLYVNKENNRHDAAEYEIDIMLKLDNINDYTIECNKSVIATDSQKNTVYILAKKYSIKSPEEFGQQICKHFLGTYQQVTSVTVNIAKLPWNRININGSEHNHAFFSCGNNAIDTSETRIATISQRRNSPLIVSAGIEGLSLLKTSQSGFTGFVNDEYRTLPDHKDRIFKTIVSASWKYQKTCCSSIDYDNLYNRIRNITIEAFAGNCKDGIYSSSAQSTLFRICDQILKTIAQISEITMKIPNIHYLDLDFTRFNKVLSDEIKNAHQVYLPLEKPYGVIFGTLKRNSSKL